MAREELILRLQMLEQQAEERKSHIEAVDKQLEEMIQLRASLNKLNGKKNAEMLANLGRGVFLKTRVDDEKVFVNVGSKILVRKTFLESIEIIDKQLASLEEMKAELLRGIEEVNHQLYSLLEEAQKEEKD